MTDELLTQANNLKSRIKQVTKLLENLDLTDPSSEYAMARISPIMLQVGMAQTIQFDVVDEEDSSPTEVQILDANIHKMIVNILKSYRSELETMFNNLA